MKKVLVFCTVFTFAAINFCSAQIEKVEKKPDAATQTGYSQEVQKPAGETLKPTSESQKPSSNDVQQKPNLKDDKKCDETKQNYQGTLKQEPKGKKQEPVKVEAEQKPTSTTRK